MIRTAILLASGFEEVEALTAVDLLRRAGLGCDMLSAEDCATVTGSHGIGVLADRNFSETDFSEYDAVILPGGLPGTDHLQQDPRVISLLQTFSGQGKLIAAICAAPRLLSKAGLLNGKNVVCYPAMEELLTEAQVFQESVMTDGQIITSRGVGTAIDFSLAIIAHLLGAEKAEQIAKSIVYR